MKWFIICSDEVLDEQWNDLNTEQRNTHRFLQNLEFITSRANLRSLVLYRRGNC